MFNLKLIVATMWLSVIWNLAYSIIVRALYNKNCQPPDGDVALDSFFKFLDRFDAFLVWQYPIIYLFWPTMKLMKQERRMKRVEIL